MNTMLAGGIEHRAGICFTDRDRLLAKDMLAGRGRLDRPFGVEVVRQRDVDGLDFGIGQHRFVACVMARNAGFPGERGRLGGIARRLRPPRSPASNPPRPW